MSIREFGPRFFTDKKNEVLYKSCLFNKKALNGFKKETKPKVNKWVMINEIDDLKKSARNCWQSYADSKAKSTNWLLINHALPVKERIKNKDEITCCPRCNSSPVDMNHVFNTCPRATEVWKSANNFILKKMGISKTLGLRSSLNPEADTPEKKILGGFNAIVIRHLWLDYCNLMFSDGEEENSPTPALCAAIHRDLKLMLHAERGLLVNDLNWWNKKVLFSPQLEDKEELQEIIARLTTRINSMSLLLEGVVSEEFGGLI